MKSRLTAKSEIRIVKLKNRALGPVLRAQSLLFLLLQNDGKQACDNPEQGHAFYKGGCQDHVGADVTSGFGLASDRLYRALTDLANTNAGTESRQTSANSATRCVKAAVNYCNGVVSLEEDGVQQRHTYGFG